MDWLKKLLNRPSATDREWERRYNLRCNWMTSEQVDEVTGLEWGNGITDNDAEIERLYNAAEARKPQTGTAARSELRVPHVSKAAH